MGNSDNGPNLGANRAGDCDHSTRGRMNPEIIKWIKIVVLKTLREKNLIHLDVSTLISCGMLGYTQALERFDPNRGAKFKTFAEYRIRGAVLDEVRKMIGDERCKTPRPRRVDNFDFTMIGDGGSSQSGMESGIDIKNFVRYAPLTHRELKILNCRVTGMNLREIAKEFGFSESRASQILAKIKRVVYVWYREQAGLKFGLTNCICPACQNENCVSDKIQEFRCDICDAPLIIINGTPIVVQREQEVEIDEEEPGHSRAIVHTR